jgi:hypothetical protein
MIRGQGLIPSKENLIIISTKIYEIKVWKKYIKYELNLIDGLRGERILK